jgi:hypothetical protein
MSGKSNFVAHADSHIEQTAERLGPNALKNYGGDSAASASHNPHTDELKHPRKTFEEIAEAPAGETACVHAGGSALEFSVQKMNCECEDVMKIARQNRMSASFASDWQLVRVVQDSPSVGSHVGDIGIVLPSNFLQFVSDFNSAMGGAQCHDGIGSITAVGLIHSGRMTVVPLHSLEIPTSTSASSPVHLDVVVFARMISESCAECHSCDNNNLMGKEITRKFVATMRVCDEVTFPDFESIFAHICVVCFNHRLDDSQRVLFLQAIRCICNFQSFKARFLTGRGILALISMLHSCQSCASAELALDCMISILTNSAPNVSKLCRPIIVEVLLSCVDNHVSAASKVITIFEKWQLSRPTCDVDFVKTSPSNAGCTSSAAGNV